MLYVFVDIKIDIVHFIETVKHNFSPASKLVLVSTVQFISSIQVSCYIKAVFMSGNRFENDSITSGM